MDIVSFIPRFRVLDQEFQKRDEFYTLGRDGRDGLRLERINRAWRKALAGSEHYRALRQRLGLPGSFRSLEEYSQWMPVTAKSEVQQDPLAFKLKTEVRGKWMSTGGSTGIPLKVFWGLPGHLASLRDQYWARRWWGVEPFDRQAMLWGHAHSFGTHLRGRINKVLVPLVDLLRNRRRFSAYRLDPDTLRHYFEEMIRFRPVSLYAYASAAYQLALANKGRDCGDLKLKAAFLAAEPILEAYRKELAEVFACPGVGEYGSIECGMLAYEHPAGGYKIFEHSVYLEAVQSELDETYEVIVTQLRDTSFPLFRYAIGDRTMTPITLDAERRETLSQICGRSHDLLRLPAGGACHGECITHIIEQIPEIVLFKIHQHQDFALTIKVKLSKAARLDRCRQDWLIGQVQRVLSPDVNVHLEVVSELERTLAGKHRFITTEIG